MDNPIATLRFLLSSTTASIPNLEAAVTAAQDRLRFATEKAAQIQGLLTMLEAEAKAAITPTVPPPPAPPRPAVEGKATPKNQRMEEEVTALLSLRGTVHRMHILQHLIDKGVMGHEKQPLPHLAAFLSGNKDKFASDGKGNFRLRRSLPPVSRQEIEQAAARMGGFHTVPASAAPNLVASRRNDAPEPVRQSATPLVDEK